MCTRAGGKDPVPFHCKGALERAPLQREQERGHGFIPSTHPYSLLFSKVTKTSSQVRGRRSCPWIKLGWRRPEKSGQETHRVCPIREQGAQSIASLKSETQSSLSLGEHSRAQGCGKQHTSMQTHTHTLTVGLPTAWLKL